MWGYCKLQGKLIKFQKEEEKNKGKNKLRTKKFKGTASNADKIYWRLDLKFLMDSFGTIQMNNDSQSTAPQNQTCSPLHRDPIADQLVTSLRDAENIAHFKDLIYKVRTGPGRTQRRNFLINFFSPQNPNHSKVAPDRILELLHTKLINLYVQSASKGPI